jgi:Xaa-Pro aminopeptidase
MKKNSTPKTDARLIIATSTGNADLYYATRIFIGDPFTFFQIGKRKFMVLSDLEIDRAKRVAQVDKVLSLSAENKRFEKKRGHPPQNLELVEFLLRERGVKSILVPSTFPVSHADSLRKKKFRVVVCEGSFYPEREIKTDAEVRATREALRITALGIDAGVKVLKKSRIGRDGFLYLNGAKLTSEFVRRTICTAILWAGGETSDPIVAGGVQACDPHERGYGPLRANQAIIIDDFPRSQKTGYHGDMTRTVVRGRASEALKKLYATVHESQKAAIKKIRASVSGEEAHNAVKKVFADAGYETGKVAGRMQGFFHGTGHGLGLEVHEPPRVSAVKNILKAGHIVTVEPGLYYPKIGGVRIEDVALVTKNGAKILSSYPYRFEI